MCTWMYVCVCICYVYVYMCGPACLPACLSYCMCMYDCMPVCKLAPNRGGGSQIHPCRRHPRKRVVQYPIFPPRTALWGLQHHKSAVFVCVCKRNRVDLHAHAGGHICGPNACQRVSVQQLPASACATPTVAQWVRTKRAVAQPCSTAHSQISTGGGGRFGCRCANINTAV